MTILFYVDEGGTGWNDRQTNFFFLASFAIHIQHWSQMDREVSALKKELFSGREPDDWELKGRDIWQGVGAFNNLRRENRLRAFKQVSETLSKLPCHIFAVQINKKRLRETSEDIKDDTGLYRLTFNQLLEQLDAYLKQYNETGILLMDSRSTQHTSVQDGRLLRVYKNWKSQKESSNFVELPLFGFSEFYTGLQLADYVVYLIDRSSKEAGTASGNTELQEALNFIQSKIKLVELP
ncbi:DUF3800 domain-containing protein [Kamptonema animale CS-326]|jgi:hypothetical protein|uniref:DUF3800 domain-containing protein n=1 Tax=Kamptonema animale TaxID=92934 RepID=UPI00232B4A75|nr:DUF3800 domain-containing protein [Kamptonema animale]MDB9514073.1 DUF3800 domain-containing protein [Kamptonema animale CS-326]